MYRTADCGWIKLKIYLKKIPWEKKMCGCINEVTIE